MASGIASPGKAARCELGGLLHTAAHRPLRFVWHHILPQACGGQTSSGNLIALCDNCHYSVHELMWQMAHPPVTARGNRKQAALAARGYDAAVTAGTAGKIPREA